MYDCTPSLPPSRNRTEVGGNGLGVVKRDTYSEWEGERRERERWRKRREFAAIIPHPPSITERENPCSRERPPYRRRKIQSVPCSMYRLVQKKVIIWLSTSLAWPAWAGCSSAELSHNLPFFCTTLYSALQVNFVTRCRFHFAR